MRHRRRYIVYALLFAVVVVNYMDRSALSVAIGPIAAEFGLSPSTTGVVLSSFLWIYILAVIPSALFTDTFGPRGANAVSIAVFSAATVATGLVGGLASLLVARVVMGTGESITFPASGRTLHEWAPTKERGVATAIFSAGAYAGPALGALLATWLLHEHGWRVMFVVLGVIGFVCFAAWVVVYRSPIRAWWLTEDERRFVLEDRGPDTPDAPGAIRLGALLRQPTIWGMAFVQGCVAYTQYLYLTWLPSYFKASLGLTVFSSGFYSVIPYAVAAVGSVAIGVFSDRVLPPGGAARGLRRYVIAACMLGGAVVLLAPLASSVAAAVTVISVSLLFVATALGMNFALVNDLVRERGAAGRANGLVVVGGNAFGLVAPIVTGFVVEESGSYVGAFTIAGVLLVVGAVAAVTLTRKPVVVAPTHRPSSRDAIPQSPRS